MTAPSPQQAFTSGPVERPAPPLMNEEETVRRDLSSVLKEIEAAEARRAEAARAAAVPTSNVATPVVPPPSHEEAGGHAFTPPPPPQMPAPAQPPYQPRGDMNKTFVDPAPLGAIVGAAALPPAQAQLNATVADPVAQEHARRAMEQAMAAARAAGHVAPGASGPETPQMAPAAPPAMAVPTPAVGWSAPDKSPLSQSVMAPPGYQGPPAQPAQGGRRNLGTAIGMAPPAAGAPPAAAPPPVETASAPPPPQQGRKMMTALGVAPEQPLPPPQAAQPAPQQGRKLMTALGIAPDQPLPPPPQNTGQPFAPEPSTASAPPPPAKNLRTMMGVAPSDLALGVAAAQHANQANQAAMQGQGQPQHAQPPQAQQAQVGPNRTMLGVAIPGVAPTQPGAQPQHQGGPQGAQQNPVGPNRTMLGVAMPGIAPTGQSAPMQAPQQLSPQAITPAPNWQPAPQVLPRPMAPEDEMPPEAPALPVRRGVPLVAVIGILAVVLLLGGGGIALMLGRSTPVTARPELDDQGKEALRVQCESCADGTMVSIGDQKGSMKGHAALVTLAQPLSVGENKITIKLEKPGSSRGEDVKLTVPVAFRIRADLSTLSARPPVITVRVEAGSGTTATVDGKPVSIDANGKGSYAIDVSADTQGPSDETKVIDKKIPFVITTRTGKAEQGMLTAKTGVVPLHVDSPLAHTTVAEDACTVAGQTAPGAQITLEGKPVKVDDKGAFVHVQTGLRDGESALELVSQMGQLAPRTAKITVKRVASLDAAAKELDGQNPLAYSAFAADPASKTGQLAAVDGEVVDVRATPAQSIFLVDVHKGCDKPEGSCLVRVVAAGEAKVAKKDALRVYGRVTKAVSSGGKSVPEIEADFWVRGHR